MTYAHGYGVGQSDAFYSPHAEPFIDCDCGTCPDVAVCAIPGHLIFAGREWLARYCEYPDGEVEAMFPADVYREIEGCWGWERFVRDATLTAQVGWAA